MKTTQDGRTYCLLVQQDGLGRMEVHPKVWSVLHFFAVNALTGSIEFSVMNGNVSDAKVHLNASSIDKMAMSDAGIKCQDELQKVLT